MSDDLARSAWIGFKRGLARRCPSCGTGRLFQGYLRVQPICTVCGHDNSAYRADDGPAYFTILIIGHVTVAPLVAFPVIWSWNPFVIAAFLLPIVAVSTLALLAFVKGAFIGVQWGTQAAID